MTMSSDQQGGRSAGGGGGGGTNPRPRGRGRGGSRRGRGGRGGRGGGGGPRSDTEGGADRSGGGSGGWGGARGVGRSIRRRGGRGRSGRGDAGGSAFMRDEDVLIAFTPYLRSNDPEATRIHSEYMSGDDAGDQRSFVRAARQFLIDVENHEKIKQQQHHQSCSSDGTKRNGHAEGGSVRRPATVTDGKATEPAEGKATEPAEQNTDSAGAVAVATTEASTMSDNGVAESGSVESTKKETPDQTVAEAKDVLSNVAVSQQRQQQQQQQQQQPLPVPAPKLEQPPSSPTSMLAPPPGLPPSSTKPAGVPSPEQNALTPPLPTSVQQISHIVRDMTLNDSTGNAAAAVGAVEAPPISVTSAPVVRPPPPPPPGGWAPCLPGLPNQQQQQQQPKQQQYPPSATSATDRQGVVAEVTLPPVTAKQPPMQPRVPPKKEWQPRRTLTRPEQQPGRILANGIPVSPDGDDGEHVALRPRQELQAKWMLPLGFLRERSVRKLQEAKERAPPGSHSISAANLTIRDALEALSVGLFRRGCTENGCQTSIISKEIVSSPPPPGSNEPNRSDFPFEVDSRTDTIWGTVPFYAPRTPGNVVLRLYFEDEPLVTLATGPCVKVQISEEDVEPTLRFILSNFKSKKGTTSVSSLHSLSAVIDQFNPGDSPGPPPGPQQHLRHYGGRGGQYHQNPRQQHQQRSWYEGAGRAAWGCICESRKVVELCASEYLKARDKSIRMEEELKHARGEGRLDNEEASDINPMALDGAGGGKEETCEGDGGDVAAVVEVTTANGGDKEVMSEEKHREKMNAIMGGRASNQRKWRDVQAAFASILKSVLSNSASSLLLKRDLLTKLRLEQELWCPLCEAFAPSPFRAPEGETGNDDDGKRELSTMPGDISNFPHPITAEHFRLCSKRRREMQKEVLGFVPNTSTIQQALASSPSGSHAGKSSKSSHSGKNKTSEALHVFNRISMSMNQLYVDEYMTTPVIHQQRERVREETERVVSQCLEFPQGTKVVIFGSSANGFGSPKSDLDMCLRLPPSTSLTDKEDRSGASAMAKVAEQLELAGMNDVDTARLTARIPVVMFNYAHAAHGLSTEGEDATTLMECDLSMQNPLACLNTSLLLAYSNINQKTRVLASLIKRWAKSRNINDPSHHTLSSYGYILMLLHFLTHHREEGNGLVSSVVQHVVRGAPTRQAVSSAAGPPLLPNLQWMDPTWVNSTPGSPYREFPKKPRNVIPHPSEPNFLVNTYFYRPADQQAVLGLKRRFAGNDRTSPSAAVLLASFFRYYAYEFDYKRYVVSLNSTASRGLVEREVKAENDGWKLYGQGLAIEDPFETFYDVAHVVKPSTFQRIRREFAMVYTKIVDTATGNAGAWEREDTGKMSGSDMIDWICESEKSTLTQLDLDSAVGSK